jgi:hypothetical protein
LFLFLIIEKYFQVAVNIKKQFFWRLWRLKNYFYEDITYIFANIFKLGIVLF